MTSHRESEQFDWQRFWHERGSAMPLTDGGYLPDPEGVHGAYLAKDLRPLAAISTYPCLVLLGEPGIGKSTAMRREHTLADAAIAGAGNEALHVDLRSCGSDTAIMREVFDTAVFSRWAAGDHMLHLFLDSLDECLLQIRSVAALLERELARCPVERLRFRIACRTADWPHGLETTLRGLWEEQELGVFQLAPLRRSDVVGAAESRALDPNAFLHAVQGAEVVPLAIKPVTLNFLLNIYAKHGESLPRTQAELYREGCRCLCEEQSISYHDAQLVGNLDPHQRMMIAGRIAVATVLGNRYAVWTGPDRGDVPEENITIHRLCGSDTMEGAELRVDGAGIRETLNTGLFSSAGPQLLGWAHQTYAEFLAADYLTSHKVSTNQLMALLVHPQDPAGRLVPQLHEVAARLACLDRGVFDQIMRCEPEILLSGDVATADIQARAALVDALLGIPDEVRLQHADREVREWYAKLAHPALAEQLRPYIRGERGGAAVREVALHIALESGLQSIQLDLAEVALNPVEPHSIRVSATIGVAALAAPDVTALLRPLLTDPESDDPDDQLRGAALRALWPGHVTAKELFAALSMPKQQRVVGLYQGFLYTVGASPTADDVPDALAWYSQVACQAREASEIEQLGTAILVRAWEHLGKPGIAEGLARALLSRLAHEHYHAEPELGTLMASDTKKRRHLLQTMLPLLPSSQVDPGMLTISAPIVLAEDLSWLISTLLPTASESTRPFIIKFIRRTFLHDYPGHHDAMYEACLGEPELARIFPWMLNGIDLNSEEAQRSRQFYAQQQEFEAAQSTPPPTPGDALPSWIANYLQECETGNCAAWWNLNRIMTLAPDSTHYGDEGDDDLTLMPGWLAATPEARARMLAAAERYVREGDPETSTWMGQNIWHRPAMAGYRALRLLLQHAPEVLDGLPQSAWHTWAGIILAYPPRSSTPDEARTELVQRAYKAAPDVFLSNVDILLAATYSGVDHPFILRLLGEIWDDTVANFLLVKTRESDLDPALVGNLLRVLLDHQISGAREFAESLVRLPVSEENVRERRVIAAGALLTHADDAGWPVVWPAVQADEALGKTLFINLAYEGNYRRNRVAVAQVLGEDELADLYQWLVRRFPPAEDPALNGTVTGRHSVAQWRDALLDQLVARGTPAACAALRTLISALPQASGLRWHLLQAEEAARRNTWQPPAPEQVLTLAQDARTRLVRNGDQLLDVLEESLKRLEFSLHDETPAAIDLWNANKRGRKVMIYTPKDENTFSDYLKRHLDADLKGRGIILNREVEFRRGQGPGSPGERTDIKVEAVLTKVSAGDAQVVTVIIEVKGCWHAELYTAMETQLVAKYLSESRCTHGLYLVGWFNCAQWDLEDRHSRGAPKATMKEVQDSLERQAADLSPGHRVSVRSLVLDTSLNMHASDIAQ